MNGVPIQVFVLTVGYVCTLRYQGGKTKKPINISHFCPDAEALGHKVVEYASTYENREND